MGLGLRVGLRAGLGLRLGLGLACSGRCEVWGAPTLKSALCARQRFCSRVSKPAPMPTWLGLGLGLGLGQGLGLGLRLEARAHAHLVGQLAVGRPAVEAVPRARRMGAAALEGSHLPGPAGAAVFGLGQLCRRAAEHGSTTRVHVCMRHRGLTLSLSLSLSLNLSLSLSLTLTLGACATEASLESEPDEP